MTKEEYIADVKKAFKAYAYSDKVTDEAFNNPEVKKYLDESYKHSQSSDKDVRSIADVKAVAYCIDMMR